MPNFAQAGEAGRALIAAHLIEGGPGDPDTLELAATLCNFAPAMVEALRKIANDSSAWGECVNIAADVLARIDGTPTAQPAGDDLGILRTVAGGDADWLVATASRDNPAGDTPTGEGDGLPPAEAFDLFPLTDWQFEVANGDTKRGYADWVRANLEQQQEATANAAEPTAICCTSCGSTSVCSDAAARWNGSDWELSSTYDDSTCDACGYEGSGFVEVPLSELRAWREDQGFDADALEKDEAE